MLAAELLKTMVRGDTITPAFVEPDDDSLALAEDIIRAFADHTGKKLGELRSILDEMEDQGFDYRLVRGLVELLERRCDLNIESPISPAIVRREVFKLSADNHPVISEAERRSVIRQAAEKLDITPEAVEASMFADLENEQVIVSFSPPKAAGLLYEYNLSIAQTMLFKATEMRFRASAKHKDVLRAVKRLGLMYSASSDGDRLDISIDGPLSALKSTERYGTSLARLLPFIVFSPGWSMEASIVRKDFNGNPRMYRFSMSESSHGPLFGDLSRMDAVETFDSELEERFYESFGNAGTGWRITREPEPLIAGKYLYIPDFLLEKDGVKVYMEIAGFWTAEYLKRKAAKLGELKGVNLIVLASSRTSCDAFKGLAGDVILFDKKIPLKDVLDRLRVWDEKKVAEGVSALETKGLRPQGDIVSVGALASDSGVPPEAIKRYAEEKGIAGYVLAGDELVSDAMLKTLRDTMPKSMKYSEVVALLRAKGITSVDPVLKLLGYTVKWSGLDPEGATVSRK